jgi:hypothetical protein
MSYQPMVWDMVEKIKYPKGMSLINKVRIRIMKECPDCPMTSTTEIIITRVRKDAGAFAWFTMGNPTIASCDTMTVLFKAKKIKADPPNIHSGYFDWIIGTADPLESS